MPRLKKGKRSFHFDIRKTKQGLRIKPRDPKSLASIQALSFAAGSCLFKAVVSRLIRKPAYVGPDQIVWPPLPNPLGILTGKQRLRMPNHRYSDSDGGTGRCIECSCDLGADGGCECHWVPCK
jgi:hypothetical protein